MPQANLIQLQILTFISSIILEPNQKYLIMVPSLFSLMNQSYGHLSNRDIYLKIIYIHKLSIHEFRIILQQSLWMIAFGCWYFYL